MTEADYICFLAKNISRGLYQNGGFCVLPYLVNDKKAVYFPDLDYSKDFWNLIKKCRAMNLGEDFPEKAIKEVFKKLKNVKNSRLIKKDSLVINLLETEYGTPGSYFVNKNTVYMTQRIGNSKADFDRTLLSVKLKIKNKDKAEIGEINWYKRQGVIEYLFGKIKSKLSAIHIKDSNEYLNKFGFSQTEIKINYKIFTKQEENLIKELISLNGEILTFDQTAEILWRDNSFDKYSPQAMAKVIENLRKKIRNQGINRELIFTKRGRGYYLNS